MILGFPDDAVIKTTYLCRKHERCRFDPWVGKIPWGRKWQPAPVLLLGKFEGQGGWWATVHEITKNRTRLSN